MADIYNQSESKLTRFEIFPKFKENIKKDYPASDGWKVYTRFNWVSYLHDFVVQRETEELTERVVVEINTDSKITDEQIDQLSSVANRLSNGDTRVIRKILVISEEAEINQVPSDIEVWYLNSFLSSKGKEKRGGDKSDKLVA